VNPIVANNPSTLFSKGILNQKRPLDSKLDLGFIYTAVELWTIFGELGNPFKTSPTISQRERHAYCILFISYCLCWFYCRPLRKHVRSMTTQDPDRLMLKHLKNRIWTHVLYLVPVPALCFVAGDHIQTKSTFRADSCICWWEDAATGHLQGLACGTCEVSTGMQQSIGPAVKGKT